MQFFMFFLCKYLKIINIIVSFIFILMMNNVFCISKKIFISIFNEYKIISYLSMDKHVGIFISFISILINVNLFMFFRNVFCIHKTIQEYMNKTIKRFINKMF